MPSRYIKRMVNLELRDYQLVRRLADQKGFGLKGFSAAVRFILREWETLTGFTRNPDPEETSEANHSPVNNTDPNSPNFKHPPFP